MPNPTCPNCTSAQMKWIESLATSFSDLRVTEPPMPHVGLSESPVSVQMAESRIKLIHQPFQPPNTGYSSRASGGSRKFLRQRR